jgi:cytoskeletal protein CcmA (bactofilin family)
MILRCPACGSKDLWRPRRHKSTFDLLIEKFGYRRFDCRGCWKRPILRVGNRQQYAAAVAEAAAEAAVTAAAAPPVEVAPQIPSPPVQREEPVAAPVSVAGPEPTVIGPTMVIQGEVYSNESIRVHGRLEGVLQATDSRVVIEPEGSVKATVRAADVIVRGRLEGETVASGSITVCRDGRLIGEAKTARLVVEDGAYVKGKNETGAEAKPRKPAKEGKASNRQKVPQA